MGDALDSKFVDIARIRNLNMQRQLTLDLETLAKDREISRERIRTEQRLVKQDLRNLKARLPGAEGRGRPATVLPRGLTDEQKAKILEIKKEKPGIITLDEFERKLAAWRRSRELQRYAAMAEKANRNRKKNQRLGRFASVVVEDDSPSDEDSDTRRRRNQFVRTCCVSKSADGLQKQTTFLF